MARGFFVALTMSAAAALVSPVSLFPPVFLGLSLLVVRKTFLTRAAEAVFHLGTGIWAFGCSEISEVSVKLHEVTDAATQTESIISTDEATQSDEESTTHQPLEVTTTVDEATQIDEESTMHQPLEVTTQTINEESTAELTERIISEESTAELSDKTQLLQETKMLEVTPERFICDESTDAGSTADQEVQDTSRQSMSYSVDVEGGGSSLPLTVVFPAALATTTTASAIAPEILEVMVRSVQAQERLAEAQQRLVELEWIGLKQRGADMSRMMSLKEEEIKVAVKSTSLMEETKDLRRSKFEYEVLQAQNQAASIGCAQLCKICADDLMVGMLVMTTGLGCGTWNQSPRWFTHCAIVFEDKPSFSWQYMSWMVSAGEVLWRSFVCVCRGSFGILAGMLAFLLLASFMFRLLNSGSTESMPGTVIIVVCGGLIGYAGKQTVNLLGGNGGNWFLVWEVLCCCHALANYKSKALYQFFRRVKHRTMVEGLFHFLLTFFIPALAGFFAFAESW